MSKAVKSLILDVEGTVLSDRQREFYAEHNPLGFIVFARNCESPKQLKTLTDDLKASVDHDNVLILVDQEGGRVQRLKPPAWRGFPATGVFAKLALEDLEKAKEATYLSSRLMAQELTDMGINVDCAPMLDLRYDYSDNIIGDRAFGSDPEIVATLAREQALALLDGGVLPIIKHIPGHGRATADSHEELPIVGASLQEMQTTDFVPFKALNDMPFAMTAHITYAAIDDAQPATFSHRMVDMIREDIGFDGLLFTDDLMMKALSGDFSERAERSYAAGCDVLLPCNGTWEQNTEVAESAKPLTIAAKTRLARAWSMLHPPDPFDAQEAEARLKALLG